MLMAVEGGEKEGIMVSQDYLAVLLIMFAMLLIDWGINHTLRH
jgi:hypothetical protein